MMSFRTAALVAALGLVSCAREKQAASIAERSLGNAEVRFAQPFTRITGIRELGDGRVLVADGAEKSVIMIDSTFGSSSVPVRQGQGPAEFSFPSGLLAYPGDTTLLHDMLQTRLLLLDPSGRPVRTISLPQRVGFGAELKADGRGSVYIRGNPLPRPEQMREGPPDSAQILRWNLASGVVDTIASLALPRMEVSESDGNFSMMIQPMTPADEWAVTQTGWIGLARHTPYSVDWVGTDSRLSRGAPIPYTPVAVVEADKEEYRRARQEQGSMQISMSDGGGDASISEGPAPSGPPPGMPELKWPTHKPPFLEQSVLAGPDNQLWILRTQPAGQALARYDVIDSTGAVQERVTVPAGSRIVGFGASSVYVARTDADGLQWLERFRRP
jgi:hypothetical protein